MIHYESCILDGIRISPVGQQFSCVVTTIKWEFSSEYRRFPRTIYDSCGEKFILFSRFFSNKESTVHADQLKDGRIQHPGKEKQDYITTNTVTSIMSAPGGTTSGDDGGDEAAAMLVAMGFPPAQARTAAQLAGPAGVEGALNLIELGMVTPTGEMRAAPGESDENDNYEEQFVLNPPQQNEQQKATFVVRQDLGMSPGKIAAQIAHSALSLVTVNERSGRREAVKEWQRQGEKIVVLQVADLDQLRDLMRRAAESTAIDLLKTSLRFLLSNPRTGYFRVVLGGAGSGGPRPHRRKERRTSRHLYVVGRWDCGILLEDWCVSC